MTNLDKYGLRLFAKDLSTLTPGNTDDGRIFLHDGSTMLTLTDATTSNKEGHYMWDDATGAWQPLMHDADTVDGKHASDFAAAGHLHDDRYYTKALANSTFVDVAGDTITGSLTVSGADLTVVGPDDAAGTVTFQPGADTATAGTPSMTVDLAGSDLKDGLTSIWDATNGHVPASSIQQGAGSGLDADTIDNLTSGQFLRSDAADTGLNRLGINYPTTGVYDDATASGPYSRVDADSFHTNGLGVGQIYIEGAAIDANTLLKIGSGNAGGQLAQTVQINNPQDGAGNAIWHAGNDGGGSGLHADLLDGYHVQKDGAGGTGIINFKTV